MVWRISNDLSCFQAMPASAVTSVKLTAGGVASPSL